MGKKLNDNKHGVDSVGVILFNVSDDWNYLLDDWKALLASSVYINFSFSNSIILNCVLYNSFRLLQPTAPLLKQLDEAYCRGKTIFPRVNMQGDYSLENGNGDGLNFVQFSFVTRELNPVVLFSIRLSISVTKMISKNVSTA